MTEGGRSCDPAELRAVKDALGADARNIGIGVLHEPTGRIHLMPINSLPDRNGHAELVELLKLSGSDCKGFIIALGGGVFVVLNQSHLNGPQGTPGSLKMPAHTFNNVLRELTHAGL